MRLLIIGIRKTAAIMIQAINNARLWRKGFFINRLLLFNAKTLPIDIYLLACNKNTIFVMQIQYFLNKLAKY